MDINKFAKKVAELHYQNQPNAIIDEPYRERRMNTLIQQIESEFKISNLAVVMYSTWLFYDEGYKDRPHFKVKATTAWEAYAKAYEHYGPQVEDMMYCIE